jgi:hypothetical protein
MTAVMLARGGTFWRMADASPPADPAWQHVPVDPAVIAARVAGVSHGLLVFDDTGSEWTRNGEQWDRRLFPNRFVHSRESGSETAPRLSVRLGPSDNDPPPAPGGMRSAASELPAGELFVYWKTPEDRGPAGTVGFFVEIDGKPVPRYLIPAAGAPGDEVEMHLRDLDLAPGAALKVEVRAVDGAGNRSTAASLQCETSATRPMELRGFAPKPLPADGPLPQLGPTEVAVVDALDKIVPATGRMIPSHDPDYLHGNHLWSARRRHVRLAGARNEFVAFQVALSRPVEGLEIDFEWSDADDEGPALPVETFRYRNVPDEDGALPDPLLPFSADEPGDPAGWNSLLCELYIPHDAAPGAHRATLTLAAGDASLELDVLCWVWGFTLPDRLSFLPEMNCYGLPENERDYYRLAHKHRTVLNRVPYHHNGTISEGCAPALDDGRLDWQAWDARFAAYLDGTAFADLPRAGVPLECFYLPLHENWPGPMSLYYKDTYWADTAFRPGYRELFVDVAAQFARHFADKGWNDTLFHFYLNNKVDYKRNGWSRATSPWLLDEPANYQDFWALRYFGEAFHQGVRRELGTTDAGPKLVFRADISRPQWQRDTLDHLLDYNVVNGHYFREYRRLVLQRKRRHGQIVVDYGATNRIGQSNMQPVGWCLDSWTLGSDGVVPWQTIGNEASWTKADQLALFYPGGPAGLAGPVPSIRLKAYRRGQQDVEYLTMLTEALGKPRWAVGRAVRDTLKLASRHETTDHRGPDDAGRILYSELNPEDAWALRIRVAQVLDRLSPEEKKQWVEFRTPIRYPDAGPVAYARLPENWTNERVAAGRNPAGQGASSRGSGDDSSAPDDGPVETVTHVLQSRQAVYDAIIDPTMPEESLGRIPEDNRLRRREQANAFLVKFDLSKMDLPPRPQVERARLSFYVWDPSNSGYMGVAAFPLETEWDEYEATWSRPSRKTRWKGGEGFSISADAGPRSVPVIIPPNADRDIVFPPIEYRLDITEAVRDWLSGERPNYGVAVMPLLDRSIDEGHYSRIQIIGAESKKAKYVPKLEIELRKQQKPNKRR